MAATQVIILAGGRGERLHPLTAHTPKPLLPVLGRPLLAHLIEHLAGQPEVDEILVTTGYLGSAVRAFVEGLTLSVPVRVVHEEQARGTAGTVVGLCPQLRSPFAVISGDAALSLDLGRLGAEHRRLGAVATLCVAPPEEHLRFGIVEIEDGRVRGFVEKPALCDLRLDSWVNTGCYILSAEACRDQPTHGPVDFARDIFPRLLRAGQTLGSSAAAPFWRDVGTAESFRDIHLDAIAGVWPWPVPRSVSPDRVGRDAVIVGTVHFGPGVTVGDGARLLGPAYIGPGSVIGHRAEVSRSVLVGDCHLGANSVVRDAVVDSGAYLAPGGVVTGGILGRTTPPSRATVKVERGGPMARRFVASIPADGRPRQPAPVRSPA